jgi:hypothetical protein
VICLSAIDLIDQLNALPTLPEKLDNFSHPEPAITDKTTLVTLAVSLQSLKFPFDYLSAIFMGR